MRVISIFLPSFTESLPLHQYKFRTDFPTDFAALHGACHAAGKARNIDEGKSVRNSVKFSDKYGCILRLSIETFREYYFTPTPKIARISKMMVMTIPIVSPIFLIFSASTGCFLPKKCTGNPKMEVTIMHVNGKKKPSKKL